MTKHVVRSSGLLLALLGVIARSGYAQGSDILTLVSPNEARRGLFGVSVSGAGDVNQDGLLDVMVGAVGEQRAYVFSGQDGSVLLELVSPNEETLGRFGDHLTNAGDVNGDGVPDVVVGAWGEDPGGSPLDAGRAYVFSGRNGGLLFAFSSPNEEAGGHFGYSVSDVGDVNQDGYPDVIVGAEKEDPGPSPLDAGRAYLFSGRDGNLLFELISPNEEADGHFGEWVSEAGDVNRDGYPDMIVGAYQESPGTSPDEAGRVYLFSGKNGSLLLEFKSPNEEEDGYFGYSVSSAGDVNQDGIADVIVGASKEGPAPSPAHAGRAYVFNGQDGSLIFELKSPNEEERGGFGQWVSDAGDVDQDGSPDVIVGAFNEHRRGALQSAHPFGSGRAYVFSGQDGSLLVELKSPNEEEGGVFGASVAGAGDLDQDGVSDVIVGAFQEDPGGSPESAGRAYVFLTLGRNQ